MTAARFSVLWVQAAGCGGCTMSLLGTEEPGLTAAFETFGIDLLWHPALSEQSGGAVLALLESLVAGERPLDALLVEGTVLRGPNGTGRFQMMSGSGRSVADWISLLARRARYTVAVGSCAAFGGIPAAAGEHTDGTGLHWLGDEAGGLLGEHYLSAAGLPVVNIAGCAPHPGWIIETLAALALGDLAAADLDHYARPRAFADHLAHHGCARNEFYEFKASAARPSDRGCLMENLGCKATQAPGDCNMRRWNGHGSCTDAGYACINCTSPGFEHPSGPFLETPKLAGIPVGLPVDMPKAWFVALAALSKSATPGRVRQNAHADHVIVPPVCRARSP